LATVGAFFSLGVSFLAAGVLAGADAPGVSEICADAPLAANRQQARIDIGRSSFIPGAIPVRLT
jgi:hypothetical protein